MISSNNKDSFVILTINLFDLQLIDQLWISDRDNNFLFIPHSLFNPVAIFHRSTTNKINSNNLASNSNQRTLRISKHHSIPQKCQSFNKTKTTTLNHASMTSRI